MNFILLETNYRAKTNTPVSFSERQTTRKQEEHQAQEQTCKLQTRRNNKKNNNNANNAKTHQHKKKNNKNTPINTKRQNMMKTETAEKAQSSDEKPTIVTVKTTANNR